MRLALLGLLLATACRTTTAASEAGLSTRDRARLLVTRGRASEAVPLYEALYAGTPGDLSLGRALAEAHVKAGSDAAFVAQLSTRDTAVSHYLRGLVLFARAADASGPAVAAFQRAVELAPDEPEFAFRLGIALLESERDDEAKPWLEKAVARASARPGWLLPLAKARFRTGDRAGAVAAIRDAMHADPTEGDAATAKALMGQIADPFAGFPQAAKAQLEQGINWLQVADVPQQAIVSLDEVARAYPDLAVVHALLGLAYARLDDAGRAVDELKRAIELAPDDGKNHLYLAELYLGRQRVEQARALLAKAVELNPALAVAWFRLGDLALERQSLDDARKAFRLASRLEPDDGNARGKLALVYQLEGDWPAADRELNAVMEREPSNLDFMLRLGLLHTERFIKTKGAEKQVAADEAGRWLAKVLEAQPENVLASKALERIKGR
ncbi:MAG: tetratricopeptide repeat protein [Archangium sp.]|nr:tetratricopeptide repeat protein [Archangium sp.]